MAFIKEEIEHDELNVTITVLEREKSEASEPWSIINIEVDNFENYSPKELRRLGKWLIEQGKRIGREYKSNGAVRSTDSRN